MGVKLNVLSLQIQDNSIDCAVINNSTERTFCSKIYSVQTLIEIFPIQILSQIKSTTYLQKRLNILKVDVRTTRFKNIFSVHYS